MGRQQTKTKPNSYYKGQEIKRLAKHFEEQGVTRARARELAKIWHKMSPEQRQEVLNEKAQ